VPALRKAANSSTLPSVLQPPQPPALAATLLLTSCFVYKLFAGMGAQKDMGLGFYAEAFANGGLAAFVFDYRGFGGSDGEPRQWVSPTRHVEVSHLS
jgi:alpha-beta hydrolase superfamily lysophospholipase